MQSKIDNAIQFERNQTRKMIEQESKKQAAERAKMEATATRRGTTVGAGSKDRTAKPAQRYGARQGTVQPTALKGVANL